mmetsp:Transcript_32323/g.96512  ORF Transcript_32323/g.96512 Transcript_32323/m.96512 type:complete len:534 (-) Transcript_32323:519-2120(-)
MRRLTAPAPSLPPRAVLTHTYAPLNGTSHATPIVAGVAAVVASLLGAASADFYAGARLRGLLMASASPPTAGRLPFASGGRVNAGAAMGAAVAELGVALPSLRGRGAPSGASASLLVFQGFNEAWYAAASPASPDAVGEAIDISVRAVWQPDRPPSFAGFKYGGSALVALTARVRLNSTGVWSVKVRVLGGGSSGGGGSVHVRVGGEAVPMASSAGAGAFLLTGAGWLNFELRISHPDAAARYELLLRGPTEQHYAPYYDFASDGPATGHHLAPTGAPRVPLSAGLWQAFFNATAAAVPSSPPLTRLSLAAAAPGAAYAHAAVVRDAELLSLNHSTLLPGGMAPSALLGYLQSFTLPSSELEGPLLFHVACSGCQLYVDGQLVVDAYEPVDGGAPFVAKASPCVRLAAGAAHALVVRVVAAAAAAPDGFGVQLTYVRGCDPTGTRWPLGPLLYNPYVWEPDGAAAGYVGGLQCDVYNVPPPAAEPTLAAAEAPAPAYKARLPAGCGPVETLGGGCSAEWSFSLEVRRRWRLGV